MLLMTMKTWIGALALLAASAVQAQAVVGQAAPAFSIADSRGKTVNLADYKGRHVVLEWVNPGCPFVRKHYDSGNMPATQKGASERGVVWLTVSSTAPSAADYRPPAALEAWLKSKQAVPHAVLMDDAGTLGRAYGARTTPHLYLIDPAGLLVYAGAIDSKPTANPADIKSATNYVNVALAEALAGRAISRPVSQAYGCSIKYGS